tara:strand:+ start:385 stop:729 length:345 start_codon:yes stop_codon:yes gene_type:complete
MEKTDKLKGILQEWILLDNEINERNKYIKELKKKRDKEIEPLLIQFMKDNNMNTINNEQGKFKYIEKYTKQPFNKKNIRENLSNIFNNESILNNAMDKIINNREIKTTFKFVKK